MTNGVDLALLINQGWRHHLRALPSRSPPPYDSSWKPPSPSSSRLGESQEPQGTNAATLPRPAILASRTDPLLVPNSITRTPPKVLQRAGRSRGQCRARAPTLITKPANRLEPRAPESPLQLLSSSSLPRAGRNNNGCVFFWRWMSFVPPYVHA